MKPDNYQDEAPRPSSRYYGIMIGLVVGGIVLISCCCISGLLIVPNLFTPSIVGMWQGDNGMGRETIQFFSDGTYEEAPWHGGRTKGKYELLDGGRIKIEKDGRERTGTFSVSLNKLDLTLQMTMAPGQNEVVFKAAGLDRPTTKKYTRR